MSQHKPSLSDERSAISEYLDALLFVDEVNEPTLSPQAQPATAEVKRPASANLSVTPVIEEPSLSGAVITHTVEIPDVLEETTTEVEVVAEVEIAEVDQPEATTLESTKPSIQTIPQQADDEIPAWAKTSFKVLLFKVSGLTLSVPIVRLKGMIKRPLSIRPISMTPNWFVGVTKHKQGILQVVDTHQLIMPGRSKPELANDEHVMLICDGLWGLTVDALEEVITVEPEQVQWRGKNGKRPWLAGTLTEKLTAILDVDALQPILEQHQNN